ncbi:MAG: hypothetical protein IJS42_01195 [Synergistaceae bacterium]|nr:hypothetical protein [Synergistaceae bacterium]
MSLSKSDDVIICDSKLPALFVNLLSMLFRSKRQIISFEWLAPYKRHFYLLEKLAMKNKNFIVALNSPDSEKLWRTYFGKTDIKARFTVIPDVYGSNSKFQPLLPRKEKYIFCGGFSNRDWPMIMKIARLMPDVEFWCAALKRDFDRQMKGAEIPPNVHMHYNIPADEYYQKMHDAYAVVIALRYDRVSGLINIIRSAVEGVLCIINKTDATNQYYTDENRDLLIDTREPEQWADKIREVLNFSDEEYIRRAEIFQNYIRDNFSPSEAAKKIYSLIQE